MEFADSRPISGGFFMGIDIVRRSDSGGLAGEVKSIAVPYSGSFTSHSVTAVITKSGNLRLIDWHVGASGMVTRTADSGNQAGEVSAISIAMGEQPLYVTAVRSGSGKLLLISWSVGSNTIQRLADSGNLAGEADLIRIVRPAKAAWATRTCSLLPAGRRRERFCSSRGRWPRTGRFSGSQRPKPARCPRSRLPLSLQILHRRICDRHHSESGQRQRAVDCLGSVGGRVDHHPAGR